MTAPSAVSNVATSSAYDRVRDFWNGQPCNFRNSDKEALTKDWFDEIERNRYFVEPHLRPFAQFDRWAGKKVLEIGCGIGTDAINFARAGAEVTLVDFSERSIEICRQRFALEGLTARFHHGNAEELATFLPGGTYDLIFSYGVIHHTPHPEKVIEQLRHYSGPRTELRMMVYSKVSWKLFWMMFEYGVVPMADADRLIASYSEAKTGCPVTYTYTFEEAGRLLAPHFQIDSIWKDQIFVWNVEDYRKRKYTVDKYWSGTPQSVIAEYARELGWHTLIVAHPVSGSNS
jgi:2-polyprenyl-3-methyl-5-hydroxy-6-metoxy-1,4-benzoquinol methylase